MTPLDIAAALEAAVDLLELGGEMRSDRAIIDLTAAADKLRTAAELIDEMGGVIVNMRKRIVVLEDALIVHEVRDLAQLVKDDAG